LLKIEFIDLKSKPLQSHTCASLRKEMAHELRKDGVLSLPSYEFRLCVDRYHGNYKVQSFSCWDQFLSMAFAQLSYRESLRDIETCLRAAGEKLYHMGIRGKVSRNTLAHANEVRDWRIYQDFAQMLIQTAREFYQNDPLQVQLDQTAYGLDSTIVDLCLSLFPWAKFRKRKAAVKLHTFWTCVPVSPPQ
jgi:hypothetical protein